MSGDLISREALKKSINDELERLNCVLYKNNDYYLGMKRTIGTVLDFIDKAPTVPQDCSECKRFDSPYFEVRFDEKQMQEIVDKAKAEVLASTERPQDKFVEMLNDRISKSVCKYCQMNKHCELCEISRVFSIIALTNEEMKEGEKHDGSNQP